MTIKIDLENAYDRLRWEFIRDTLIRMQIPIRLAETIMQCVDSAELQILWNRSPDESFKPSRGICQGDPFSPYLFVMCMERLSHIIDEAVDNGEWKPVKCSRQGPPLFHLFFACQ